MPNEFVLLDNYIFIIYFGFIILLQSSIGVGILVLGTPFLLILKYEIIDIYFILLPISILTSLINLIVIANFNKSKKLSYPGYSKKFFLICLPSVFIGLLILKYFQIYINFKILVSLIIILSVLIVIFKDKIRIKVDFFQSPILFLVGIVHGLTNSGGTLMSLSLSSKNNKEFSRYNITFFYFFLASFQYCITILFFKKNFLLPLNINFIWLIPISIILGNLSNLYVKEVKYKFIVNFIAILSALNLLLNY